MSDFDFKYGLIAIPIPDTSKVTTELEVLHFCGYLQPPTEFDIKSLDEELKIDEEFGLVGDAFIVIEAPEEVVTFYRKAQGLD